MNGDNVTTNQSKDDCRKRIVKMLNEIDNAQILNYIFIIVDDIMEDIAKKVI